MPVPILYVIDTFNNPHAGTEGQLYQLVQGLDRSRFSPHLLVFHESSYLRTSGFPCEYTVLGCSGLTSLATWVGLWKEAQRFHKRGGGIVHAFFIDPSIICPVVFRFLGIPVVISRRDMGYWYTPMYLFLLRWSGRVVSSVIANSNAVKDIVSQKEGIPVHRISVIYNGYQGVTQRAPIPESVHALREIHPDAVFCVIVANIRPIKRISDAIIAIAEVVQKGGNLHLVIVGDGDDGELIHFAKEFGVPDRVHFFGQRSDVADFLPAFDIGLLCSESEGFSNSIIEYMMAGLPVVCSSVGGNPEAVVHGVSGYLYETGNTEMLSGYLAKLVFDTQLRCKLGSAALESSKARFCSKVMVEQHQNVYGKLVS